MFILNSWQNVAAYAGTKIANETGLTNAITDWLCNPWIWVAILGVIVIALLGSSENQNSNT